MSNVSPKVPAAAAGAAIATLIWTLVATFAPDTFDATAITTLSGATGTVLAFVFGFFIGDGQRQS